MDRSAVDTSSDPAGIGAAEESSAGSPLPRRRPRAEKPAEPAEPAVDWFGTSGGSTDTSEPAPDAPAAPAEPSVSPEPRDEPPPARNAAPQFGPASPAGPGRASFGFSDGPIGGTRTPAQPNRARSASESGELPVVQINPTPAAPDPAPAPWEPVPFEPAAPRATTVDGWATPAMWPDSNRIAASWADDGADRRDPARSQPAAWSDTPTPAPAPAAPPRRRQSRLVSFGMGLLGTVAVAAIALTGVVYYTGPETEISDVLELGNGSDKTAVSGPLEGRTVATFELLAATDRVRLSIADLGTDLYRISAADGAGIRPNPDVSEDRLTLDLARDDAGAGGEVEVVLAAKVRWTLRFSGYAAERIVDLSGGRISRIEMVGGTRRAEMTLAEASGTVPMKITGGVEELVLRSPADSPVRVKVGGGAGTVTAGSRTLRDLPPGATLTPKDWQNANRYDVEAVSAIAQLTVEQKTP